MAKTMRVLFARSCIAVYSRHLALAVDSIDYADIADAVTLEPFSIVDRPAVCLIACHVGSTRLIDNLVWNPPHHNVPSAGSSAR